MDEKGLGWREETRWGSVGHINTRQKWRRCWIHLASNGVWCVLLMPVPTIVHAVMILMNVFLHPSGSRRGWSRTRVSQSNRYNRCRNDRRRWCITFWCQDDYSEVRLSISCGVTHCFNLFLFVQPNEQVARRRRILKENSPKSFPGRGDQESSWLDQGGYDFARVTFWWGLRYHSEYWCLLSEHGYQQPISSSRESEE